MNKFYIHRKTLKLSVYGSVKHRLGRGEKVSLTTAINLKSNENANFSSESVSVNQIIASKKIALRRRVWFRALSRVERGILDLTTKYVVCIRSAKLATVVTAILTKLELAAESLVDQLVRTVGFSLAQKISDLAKRFGNRLASGWATAAFARFLAVMQLNSGR